MMLKKLVTVLLLPVTVMIFFLSFSACFALDLTIDVYEKGSGDILQGVTVVLGETGEYEETDDKGQVKFFDVELPVKLKMLNVGYDTKLISLDSKISKLIDKKTDKQIAPFNVYLSPLSFESDVLEVFAERIQEKTSKITITREELRRAPGTQGDPLKAIQSLPGVVTAAEGAGIVYIRGSEPNQNITRVNRARIGYLYHFGGLHSTISPQLVSDFNMFLGGFPVEYGDSLGGALDVKLRAPKNDRLHQSYSVGTYEMSAVLEGPLFGKDGKDSAYISARRSYVDLILSNEAFTKLAFPKEEGSEKADEITQVPEFYDVQGVWQHNIKNGRLLLQQFSAKDSIKLVLNTTNKSDPAASGKLESSIEYHSASFVWEQMWNRDVNTSSTLYTITTKQKLRIGSDENNQPFYLRIDETDYIWQPELRWNFTDSMLLTFGTEFIYANSPVDAYISRPQTFNDPDYNFTESEKFRIKKRYNTGLINPYFKIRKKWFSKLTTQIGARLTYLRSDSRDEMLTISPRGSMEYELTDKTLLTGSWGRYVQLPEGAQWIREAGNPKLKNLDSEHRILGVRHNVSDLWNVQVEMYHKPMRNLVVVYDEPVPENYKNDGKGEAYGFDILVKRNFSNNKMGWLSYSVLRSTRSENGVKFPFAGDQRHTFTMVWSQPLQNTWNKWIVGFRLRANSGRPYTPLKDRSGRCVNTSVGGFEDCANQSDAESDVNFSHWIPKWGATNSARIPNFFQLDLRIDREVLFNTWKMNFYLDILNVLNTQNIVGFDYGNSYQKIANPDKSLSLGFFPSIGIEATF